MRCNGRGVEFDNMTAEKVLNQFFSSFDLQAYPATDASEKELPFLTYETPQSFFEDGTVSCAVNLWYKTDSESVPNAKAREIANRVGRGGIVLPIDGGYLWIRRGTPFSQPLFDDTDKSIKRRYILLILEYLR